MMYVVRFLILCLVATTGALHSGAMLVPPAAAQQAAQGPDYEAWERLATRAEEVIEAGRASTPALEAMREQLVEWRQRFAEAQGTNANTIRTVRDQIAALGPPPEDGAEDANIAAQREELNRRLTRLEAPVKTAALAQSRVEGLIDGIDQIIRQRRAEELRRLGPSPLDPRHWPEAAGALLNLEENVRTEVVLNWENPVQRTKLTGNLPVILLSLIAGLILLARGRRWSNRLMRGILREEASAARWMTAFVVSLGEWLLPLGGIYALTRALDASSMLGIRGELLLAQLMPAAFIFLLARWLALRLFPRNDRRHPILNLDENCRYAGRLYGASLGLVIAAFYFIQAVADGAGWSEAATNVVVFPAMVLSGLLLWRMSSLLLIHSRAAQAEPEGEESFRDRVARTLAWALIALSVVAPVLAAVGYVAAAQKMMLPSLISLLILAALLVLQRVVTELYVLITGNREAAEESLVPLLVWFALVLLSLPVFALVWGAQVTQLLEFWTALNEGVTLGEVQLSPAVLLRLVVVFALGFMLTRLFQGALRNTVLPKTRMDTGGRNAIVTGTGYIGITLAALIAITSAGLDLSSLAIVAGALSVGIGFGLQAIVSNFVSGIILLIERPISEGDWIEVGGKHGYVKAISVRSTRIETFDRTDVIVPNADFVSGTVTNYTRGNTVGRVIVPVGVAYGSDTRKVETILKEVAEDHPMVLMNPAPTIVFRGFGASSLDFEIRAILRDVNWVMNVHSDVNHEIARRFFEAGIEIPFPQQEIWIRNDTAITKPGAGGHHTEAAHRAVRPTDDQVRGRFRCRCRWWRRCDGGGR